MVRSPEDLAPSGPRDPAFRDALRYTEHVYDYPLLSTVMTVLAV